MSKKRKRNHEKSANDILDRLTSVGGDREDQTNPESDGAGTVDKESENVEEGINDSGVDGDHGGSGEPSSVSNQTS